MQPKQEFSFLCFCYIREEEEVQVDYDIEPYRWFTSSRNENQVTLKNEN